MLWEVEVSSRLREDDSAARQLASLLREKTGTDPGEIYSSRIFLVSGLDQDGIRKVTDRLLTDTTVESAIISPPAKSHAVSTLTVLPKPGVMDPAAASVEFAVTQLGLPRVQVRSGMRFRFSPEQQALAKKAQSWVANDAIEQGIYGPLPESQWKAAGSSYTFHRTSIHMRTMTDAQLIEVSRKGQLALTLEEMQTVQQHFQSLDRDPTDIELETIAQTWSEHCSHKTLKGRIVFTAVDGSTRRYENLLKQTIFAATQEIRHKLGGNDWCVSVFVDNAGIVKFHEQFHACIKVETHNRPSAIEPYGGASTGIGGVIRDVLGTGLGGKPVANTDVFCFAPPDYPDEKLPPGVLPPRQVMQGVVSGVRDYGNRMGIATVNGAVHFDERYLGNPLVFCGTIGLIPVGMESKAAKPGDLIVAIGGRTGRDGIHGATFSSAELTDQSDKVSGGAVQIGNAITEKMLLDVLLVARDRNLYRAVTDCGAGGFSSAVGEMGADLGAVVHLERAPLKYSGLSYTEIWISEAQERMVLAVPPENWSEMEKLCHSENVEAVVLGEFKNTGKLELFYHGQQVGMLDMHFLHDGRPPIIKQATWSPPAIRELTAQRTVLDFTSDLLTLLSHPTIASKEAIIRQYDHEVQGGSVIKPLVGMHHDGPGDASVIAPVHGSVAGLAVGCGLCPQFGDLDPYYMALAAVDEAVRNVVCVGADPKQTAVLDNFCWGNTDRPEVLGALVRAAEGCRDAALAYGVPFISGKDSLKNEYQGADGTRIVIPPTLLITALGKVQDVTRCVTMDLKKPGHKLYLVGTTREELGGSHYHQIHRMASNSVPKVNLEQAPLMMLKVHDAIRHRMVAACHDLSEGGLAVALAEMCMAGGFGAIVHTNAIPVEGSDTPSLEALLFGESPTRFLLEVPFEWERSLSILMGDLPCACIGQVSDQRRLTIFGSPSDTLLVNVGIDELKAAWQNTLRAC
ncbi:MAG: phosphoribosylformylglycinamidine synthase subunit PurL [Planctomycetia bacterium]|nr:phosphoribosylformylglycinamidine synthase subunit PurL [Planctomycetia bacterium]